MVPGRIERVLTWATEAASALLVVLDVGVLFAGIVARYVFDTPLGWSDELASTLFLWLAMLGAVVALRRGEHMRLTTLVDRLPAGWRGPVETFTALVTGLFVLEIILPAGDYALAQADIISPAMAVPDSWRTAAIGTGAVLMLLIAAIRLPRRSTLRQILGGLAAAALVAAVFFLLFRAGPAGLGVAFPDPCCGGRWRCDRDRGLDDRHRLYAGRGRAAQRPPWLGAALSDAGRDGVALRGDPADHRHGDGDGLGTDPIGLLARIGRRHGGGAGRQGGISRRLDPGLCTAGQRVLEGIPAMVLFGPLLFPVARALGVHEVHYAMVAILAMGVGLFAPRVAPDRAMRGVWVYLGTVFLALILVAAVPWLSIGFL
jgi:TRAP-type C4-dicarboxylate transport system permease small subunit